MHVLDPGVVKKADDVHWKVQSSLYAAPLVKMALATGVQLCVHDPSDPAVKFAPEHSTLRTPDTLHLAASGHA